MKLLDSLASAPAERPSISFGEALISAGELRQRVGRFAAGLAARGLGDGARVALRLRHGPEAIVALLGCWQAGCVAVPLGLREPPARLERVLRKAGARLVVVEGGPGGLSSRAAASAVGCDSALPREVDGDEDGDGDGDGDGDDDGDDDGDNDGDSRVDTGAATVRAQVEPRPDAPCLLLFTSGSTGVPKAVPVTADAIDVFASYWAEALGLGPQDRVAWMAPLVFDLSLLDIGASLMAGAVLAPVPERLLAFPGELARWLDDEGITCVYTVPSLLRTLAGSGRTAKSLRHVLSAGEALTGDDARAIHDWLPDAVLRNLFGPSETNVNSAFVVPRPWSGPSVPIGAPCEYGEVRIVDDEGNDCDDGELVARGATVMDGYWNEPKRARWLEDDGRWLRTGDWVRRDEQGLLWFEGRLDRLVKVRGQRVELDAVEAALLRFPAVGEAAVVPVGPEAAAGRYQDLVALLAPSSGDIARLVILIEHWPGALATVLSAIAVPRLVDFVYELPRNERGKLDRAELERLAEAVARY